MQEFTRIIGSIHRTGISSANSFIFRVVYRKQRKLLKKETKVSGNQVNLHIYISACICMHAELYVW